MVANNIAEGLERDGINTGAKKNKWHLSTIQGILRNEKYIGDALLQKTITTDFIEKTRIKNDGLLPQYYVKDSHPAIIPKDIFTQVQEEMVRRANMFSGEEGSKRRVYSSKYALSSIYSYPLRIKSGNFNYTSSKPKSLINCSMSTVLRSTFFELYFVFFLLIEPSELSEILLRNCFWNSTASKNSWEMIAG